MTSSTASTKDHSLNLKSSSASSWRKTLGLIMLSVIGVLCLQGWSASRMVGSTTELRAVLSESYDYANELERRIGYGGLIHNFKNYLLRPDEDAYRVSALEDAREALSLLEKIQENARKIGIEAHLQNTHEMLESYARRLDRVTTLSRSGIPARLVDKEVRFDDQPALMEVQLILGELDAVVDERLKELHHQGLLASLLSTASTTALGVLIVGIVAQRQRRHTETLRTLAERLMISNDNLSKANTLLRQFAGVVSHDLKTPIRYIHTFNRMIVEDKENASAVEQHVDVIEEQIQHMDTIIDSLLDFTKFGFANPKKANVDIQQLFSAIENEMHSITNQQGASLDFKVDLDSPVLMDRELLSRVFVNLLDNSLKYTCETRTTQIVVSAKVVDQQALFSVTDNGIGIEARFYTKIFEPMARLHGPQSKYRGVGIGLSLAKTIIESHGGLIWLDKEFTQGTRITFTLPLVQQEAEQKMAA